jgi:hypothetical protein
LHKGSDREIHSFKEFAVSPRIRRFLAPLLVALCIAFTVTGEPQAGLLSGATGLISGVLSALTQVVNGLVGAVLTKGAWTAQIPAGAFNGTATITMTTSSSDPALCQFDLSPASLNGFAKPVTLTAKVPFGISLASARIEWYNPQTQSWEPVPGSAVNAQARTVSAPVWHFSTYRVDGRNGW